ncbi:MAG: hypothetical protein IK076_00085 [Bacteroidales bacterium]|nr:hypothetical protein [Bacteroidales bacterium]
MKRSKISNSLYNWASFLKLFGILGILVGLFLWIVEPKVGPSVLIAGLVLTISGVLINGLAVIAEAACKYLENAEASANPVQNETDSTTTD